MRAYCSHCGQNSYVERYPDKEYLCCLDCGKVLADNIYEAGLFEKGTDGAVCCLFEKGADRAERKKRRAGDAKDSPAQTPLEATCGVLKRKSFSSKINYKALEALYRVCFLFLWFTFAIAFYSLLRTACHISIMFLVIHSMIALLSTYRRVK